MKQPSGKVAVKLSTGESTSSNYLRPDFIKDLMQLLEGTIVECNTAYGGRRGSTEYHMQIAKDHGFTDIAEVDIMDSEGEISIPVVGSEVLEENIVGSHFTDYDYFVVLSHFKGHAMAGFGGTIKNISIGIASRSGKLKIHSGGTENSGVLTWVYDKYQDLFLKGLEDMPIFLSNVSKLDETDSATIVGYVTRIYNDDDYSKFEALVCEDLKIDHERFNIIFSPYLIEVRTTGENAQSMNLISPLGGIIFSVAIIIVGIVVLNKKRQASLNTNLR